MLFLRRLAITAIALASPLAGACSVHVPWMTYLNVVDLQGQKVEGLEWVRIYNILDYTGDRFVRVSGVREGVRFPIASWKNGEECSFDAEGVELCHPNGPTEGINLERHLGDWLDAAEHRHSLRRVYLPLVVELDGRELRMALSSKPIRNTRELQKKRALRIMYEICERLEGAWPEPAAKDQAPKVAMTGV